MGKNKSKLTPEGRAARDAADCDCYCSEKDWNAIAAAAIEASEEVRRLRALAAVAKERVLFEATCEFDLEDCAAGCSYCSGED